MMEPMADEKLPAGPDAGAATTQTSLRPRSDSSSTSSTSAEAGKSEGRWGEDMAEPVNVDDAIAEFEDVRQELSRTTRTTSRYRRPSMASRFSRRKTREREADEEEAEPADPTLVDLEEYLQRTNREAADSGIHPKKVGVSFRNLTVSGHGSGKKFVRTFPEELLGALGYDAAMAVYKRFFAPAKPSKDIIHDFSGVVKPGEMLLVLGKPGSGSSTFLRALTNQRREFTNISGDIHYAGLPFDLAEGKYRGEILYNGEEDIHLPTLTVAQTLRFALRAKTPSRRTPGTSRTAFVEQMLELFAKMFGMTHVLGTMVGNQFLRGVSGGERKRVSIMEALASRATVNAWDNSTRGLDSSTAVDYIRSLRILTTLTHATTVVTLYQAGEQIYREFDKVCVIDQGHQIFYGRAADARAYFEALGYEAAPRSTTADFLTMVTDSNERRVRRGMEDKVPRSTAQLEAAFRASPHWATVQAELAAYDRQIDETAREDAANFSQAVLETKSRRTRKGSPYTISFPAQVGYLTQRELQLQLQDRVALRSRLINVIVLGLVNGSLFYQIPKTSEGAFAIGGVLFFNIIIVGWMQMYESVQMVHGRFIAAKQTKFAFYRPAAMVLAKTIADLPVLILQSAIFTIILYFMAGLLSEAGKFFINYLFVLTTVICLTAFYRAVGSFSKDINVAIRIAFLGLNVMGLFAGYMQSFKSMKSWVYKWIFYATPLSYAQEAIMVNQFHGMQLECSPSNLVPGIPGASIMNKVCTLVGAQPMSSTVSGTAYIREQFGYQPEHLWRNFGILIAFTIAYLVIAMIGVETMTFGGGGASTKTFTKASKKASAAADSSSEKIESATATPGSASPHDFEKDLEKARETELKPVTTRSSVRSNGSIYTWRGVNYTVGSGPTQKQLLTDVNGYVKPGHLTALMGPSGAGKTTLLDNLSHRKRVGVISGEFLMDGKPLMPDFERSTAFVEQQDVHDGTSTVREALQFSALLRQPQTVSKEQKFEFVEEIIRLLELEPLADALIGSPGFGLSVEERKRVTIGVELAAKPEELLFLDEPTYDSFPACHSMKSAHVTYIWTSFLESGLDSNGAASIVRFLRKLADESGLAILCTIHQPSSILFQEFDDLLLLARGGKEVYFGPIGEAGNTVINYFERNGAATAAPDANPAEYVLETIRSTPGGRTWPAIWETSKEAREMLEEIENVIITRRQVPNSRELRTQEFAMPLSVQIQAVTKRVWLHYYRDASYGYSKMFSNFSMALISGVLFLQSGNSVLEMQSRGFAVFLVLILCPMILTAVQPKFLDFRMLYETRERSSKIYSAPAWITAMIAAEIPYAILGAVVFYLPWYYMIGMPPASSHAGYEFLLLLLFQIFIPLFAIVIAAMCKDMTIISIVNPFFFVVTNGMTGILRPYAQMPYFYRSWLYWADPFTWLARGLIGNILHDIPVTCNSRELVTFQPPDSQTCGQYAGEWAKSAFGYMVDANATADCQYCQFKSGDEYLTTVNIEYGTRWRDLGIFIVYLVSNTVLAYVLYWAFREYRWGKLWARLRGRNAQE